jgi:hypothetical protein
MTYKINKTDGSLLAEIIDSAVDQEATDLTLIGKNVSGFGEYINENFVRLLENFAATSEPNYPIVGQIWFDTSENRLKVYDGNNFRIGSGPIVSPTAPLTPIQGDFWIDSAENQLYFYDGTDRVLAGPIYKDSQGISGFEVDTIYDIFNNPRTVVKLWVSQQLIGIFSKDIEFTPASTIGGFSGNIKPGFNASTLTGLKFNVTASAADALTYGSTVKTVEDFMLTNVDNFLTGSLTIDNPNPLLLGTNQELKINVNPSFTSLQSQYNGMDFRIILKDGSGATLNAVWIDNANERIGIFNNTPQATLDVTGDVYISGKLTVASGDVTTISSTELVIKDKTITLANGATNNIDCAGGGILLKGGAGGDKTLVWFDDANPSNRAWSSSENFDLTFGKTYKIGNTDVLTYTTLGPSVVNSSLTSIGALTSLTVDNLSIDGNTISSSTGPIVLSPNSGSEIDVANSRVINVEDPIDDQDAVTKKYLFDQAGAAINPWIETDVDQIAQEDQKFLVSTMSGVVTITLPPPGPFDPYHKKGAIVRFVDVDSTFDTNNLTVARYPVIDATTIAGTSAGVATTYSGVSTTSVSGTGSGLEVSVQITNTVSTYSDANVVITVNNPGKGYASGEDIQISGVDLGGTIANNLNFSLGNLDNILGVDGDLVVNTADKAFGLIYVNTAQGWKYVEF